ncbi:YigZ family protein [Lactobacillus sp. ESL0230]|uniref:YigZ family protein n=1 Tax=Lactobacillus sp. ESL0230 TaxID=2069353 RepID=UPI000EFC4A30|nr:YigZ family protein [Lactobacillus sp. ESL0230]RMC46174.1 YigZ family protein [Lactobacillus sp. ESL0230]
MMQEKNYLTIKNNGTNELIIKKSRFITTLVRTNTIVEADQAIAAITKKYRDATHNTYAYVVEDHVKASDNGEPAGTAGVPELKALQLMNLKNVTAVVTRYFGGIKLGTGGLIRAYSNSVTEAAKTIGVVKRMQQQKVDFHVAYNKFDEVQHFLTNEQIFIANTDYGVDVNIQIFVDEKVRTAVENNLTNLLAGQITFNLGEKRYIEVPITEHNYHSQ